MLQTVVGLCVFLAYGTTAGVARQLGAGDRRGALAQGIDGIWLAVVIGVLATVAGIAAHRPAGRRVRAGRGRRARGGRPTCASPSLGITPLLVMLAATGVLRGLQDTRTPLVVAVVGNVVNVAAQPGPRLRVGPVPDLGIAGLRARARCSRRSACAAALVLVVVRGARAARAPRCAPTCPGSARPPAPASLWSSAP